MDKYKLFVSIRREENLDVEFKKLILIIDSRQWADKMASRFPSLKDKWKRNSRICFHSRRLSCAAS